ncbi:hypothetical protein [Acetobacter malorum]|uniref:hypothetical protein n=1 Tax=Acetobacter malorum TaxID=178901 RepID=UPI000777326A|nr:hypothetical protein [Acetobacter malorum]KXV06223.1 hypothetical protein AD930_09180 [Acetobacter malorum]
MSDLFWLMDEQMGRLWPFSQRTTVEPVLVKCLGFCEDRKAREVKSIVMSNKSKRFSPKFRECAVRMVLEEEKHHSSR